MFKVLFKVTNLIVMIIGMVKMIYHYDGCAHDSDTESAADTAHIYARSVRPPY